MDPMGYWDGWWTYRNKNNQRPPLGAPYPEASDPWRRLRAQSTIGNATWESTPRKWLTAEGFKVLKTWVYIHTYICIYIHIYILILCVYIYIHRDVQISVYHNIIFINVIYLYICTSMLQSMHIKQIQRESCWESSWIVNTRRPMIIQANIAAIPRLSIDTPSSKSKIATVKVYPSYIYIYIWINKDMDVIYIYIWI